MNEAVVRPTIEVFRAGPEHESVLANLLTLYIHDLSEFIDLEPRADGRFEYPWLSLYWQESNRFPFIIHVDGQLAGFVFVMKALSVKGNQEIWDLAEFFILRGLRGRGVGRVAAHEIWRRFQGQWEVRVRDRNAPALEFWRRAVSAFTRSSAKPELFEVGEKRWQVFAFTSDDPSGSAGA